VLVPDLLLLELFFICGLVDSLEGVLEPTVVFLKNGVFGGEIKRILPGECKFEAAMSELLNAFICVVHSNTDSS
jgi:hypothetical protein